MKLLNKLLPVATVASVACVVTPLVTSCGSYKTYKYDLLDMGDYEYVAQKEGKLSEEKATEAYLKDVKDNKKILADDVAFYLYNQFPNSNEANLELSVGVGKIDLNDLRASYKYTLKGNYGDYEIDATSEAKNLPFIVWYETGAEKLPWKVGAKFESWEELKKDDKWEVIETAKVDGKKEEKKYNSESSDDELKYVFESGLVDIGSHYLEKVQIEKK